MNRPLLASSVVMVAVPLIVASLMGALASGTVPAAFPELPRKVVSDLQRRGCIVPPDRATGGGRNVLIGDFSGRGLRDSAILCKHGQQASLLLYLDGQESAPAVFNTTAAGLDEDPEASRAITVKRSPHGSPCVEDGIGMGSSVYCYGSEGWIKSGGAD
jgi:hypothetical protein